MRKLMQILLFLTRRQYAESWKKMQELRAQIQAQLKLADTLRKLGEHAGTYKHLRPQISDTEETSGLCRYKQISP